MPKKQTTGLVFASYTTALVDWIWLSLGYANSCG